MAETAVTTRRASAPFLIAFLDITPFTRASSRRTDDEIAELMDEYYASITDAVRPSGGRVVKFLGDGALAVWPEGYADDGVATLLALRDRVNGLLRARGWDASFLAKAHYGTAVAGEFGKAPDQRFDIIGGAVMTAARLEARTISISPAAFRQLKPETRKRLRKHTPPVVYIPADDPRP